MWKQRHFDVPWLGVLGNNTMQQKQINYKVTHMRACIGLVTMVPRAIQSTVHNTAYNLFKLPGYLMG